MYCGQCGASNPDGHKFCAGCGQRLTSTPEIVPHIDVVPTMRGLAAGQVLLGRYRVQRPLGRGGMGEVYLADDQTLGHTVAVKLLRPELGEDPRAVTRLKKEATLAMRLSHPAIVRVNHFEDGRLLKFLVMEYVEGETLAARLGRDGALGEAEARRIGAAVAEALAHAHAEGVIHRDLKPGNVMLTPNGRVKLADFGVAHAAQDSMTMLTGFTPSGTLPYMAPEALMGASSERSDLYALGVVLYEMVRGEPPFSSGDISTQILHREPDPLPQVTGDFGALVQQLLAKQPEARLGSAADVRDELDGTAARRREETLARERATDERARVQKQQVDRDQRQRKRQEENARREEQKRRDAAEAEERHEEQRQRELNDARRQEEERRRALDEDVQREKERRLRAEQDAWQRLREGKYQRLQAQEALDREPVNDTRELVVVGVCILIFTTWVLFELLRH